MADGAARTSSKDRRPSLHADALTKSAEGSTRTSQNYLAVLNSAELKIRNFGCRILHFLNCYFLNAIFQGERRLSVTSLRLRSDIEMWLMEEAPKLFGVPDSSTLKPSVQEDAQSTFLNGILFEKGYLISNFQFRIPSLRCLKRHKMIQNDTK